MSQVVAVFSDINISQGSVARPRCGGILLQIYC